MLTWSQGSILTKDSLLSAIFKSVFAVDDLQAIMPWARSPANFTYFREGTQISAASIAAGGAITAAAQESQKVTVSLRTIAASAQVAGPVWRNMSDNLDQMQVQMAAVGRALARKLKTLMVTGSSPTVTTTCPGVIQSVATAQGPYLKVGQGTIELDYDATPYSKLRFRAPGDTDFGAWSADLDTGDPVGVILTSGDGVQYIAVDVTSATLAAVHADTAYACVIANTSNEFDGLKAVVTNTVTGATGTGDAISFALLRYLVDAVDPDAGPLVIVSPRRTIRAIKDLYDAKGGTTPMALSLKNYGVDHAFLTFDDIPILPNDYLPVTESKGGSGADRTSLYCLNLALPTGAPSNAPFKAAGLCGLYGAGERQETDEGPTMGVTIRVDEMPRDGDGKLIDAVEVAVMGDYGLASFGTKSSARLYGITN